jgi:hypothetical protein
VWAGQVPTVFVVGDVQALMPELAHITVMTTPHQDLSALAGGPGQGHA